MTIEISAPLPAANTNVRPGARPQNPQTAGEAPAMSFLSLLSGMGLGAAETADAGAAMPGSGLLGSAEYLTDTPVGSKPEHQDGAAQAGLAQMPLAADWWAAAAAAVSGAASATTGPPTAPATANEIASASATSSTTAGLPVHAPAAGQRPGATLTAASARAGTMELAQPAAGDAALSQPAARLNATSELQQLPALALMAQQSGDATPVSPRDFMARAQAARVAAEPDAATQRATSMPVSGTPSSGQVVSMFEAAAAGLRGGVAARSQERHQTRMAGPGNAQGMVTWGDATAAGTQHGASPVYAPGALTPAPATAMAEKVHYWVSRGVQSASLQLDAFAGGSVDVNIAVKGDEAVIEFRTDQPQARQLLLEAMPQLKELLANEGLLLSGGFVGSSAQQDGQSQGRGAPEPIVGEALVAAPQATKERALSLDGVSGGRVDLFV